MSDSQTSNNQMSNNPIKPIAQKKISAPDDINDKNNNGIDFGFKEKIPIRVTVEDFATCPSLSSLGWEFESKEKSSGDLGAFINGRLYSMEGSNVGASIYPTSAAYFYGKERAKI